MAITESLNLAGKLDECADIARRYSSESDNKIERKHFAELASAIMQIRRLHLERDYGILVSYVHVKYGAKKYD